MKKPYRGRRQQRMTPFDDDSFSVNFDYVVIGTQYSDSSNGANLYHPYNIGYS